MPDITGAASIALMTRLNGGQIPIPNPLFEKDQIGIMLGLLPIVPLSATLVRSMDTGTDVLEFTCEWPTVGDANYNPLFDFYSRPYGNVRVMAFCGIVQCFEGETYKIKHSKNGSGRTKTITCYSYTKSIIDSHIDNTTGELFEAVGTTLYLRCLQLCTLRGISVVLDVDPIVIAKANEPFDKVTCDTTETIFEHLVKLAKQRGLLLSCTFNGKLFITRAHVLDIPLSIVVEDAISIPEGYECEFDTEKRWNRTTCFGQPKNKLLKNFGIAFDLPIKFNRTRNISANDTIPGGAISAASYEKNKSVRDAYHVPWNCNTWYSDPLELLLWQPNTQLTIANSLTLNILIPFNFLIKTVTYKFDNNGSTAQLDLVPPQTFTDDPVLIEPWMLVGSNPLGL